MLSLIGGDWSCPRSDESPTDKKVATSASFSKSWPRLGKVAFQCCHNSVTLFEQQLDINWGWPWRVQKRFKSRHLWLAGRWHSRLLIGPPHLLGCITDSYTQLQKTPRNHCSYDKFLASIESGFISLLDDSHIQVRGFILLWAKPEW